MKVKTEPPKEGMESLQRLSSYLPQPQPQDSHPIKELLKDEKSANWVVSYDEFLHLLKLQGESIENLIKDNVQNHLDP